MTEFAVHSAATSGFTAMRLFSSSRTSQSFCQSDCWLLKVTAVQVTLSNQQSDWQKDWEIREDENKRIAVKPLVAAE